ncbi:hypothetical protein GCM10025331_86460 [Actinoplanes utahensis]
MQQRPLVGIRPPVLLRLPGPHNVVDHAAQVSPFLSHGRMMAQASKIRGWRSLPCQMSAARIERFLHRIKLGPPPLYGVRIGVTVTVMRTAETDLSRPKCASAAETGCETATEPAL